MRDVFVRKTARLALCAGLLSLLTACLGIFGNVRSVIVHKPPESREGKLCVAECTYKKNSCIRKCQKISQDCSIQERKLNTFDNIVGVLGGFIKGTVGIGEKSQSSRVTCSRQKQMCASECGPSNRDCSSKCEMEYRNCESSSIETGVNFKIGDLPFFTTKKSTCDTKNCYSSCESDYGACFVGCGGSIYTETPETHKDNGEEI